MANYTSTANVVLSVNGKQAQNMLSQLEKDARRLEKQITKAATAGDKATMKKLQREMKSTQRMMDQLKGSSASVDTTLRRLDKASPKELNKVLRQLKSELNGIERGSSVWDNHVAKIKAVKTEIDRVNKSMRNQESFSDRVANWMNKWQMAIVGVGAAITGLIMTGRKAVQAYAEMDQEMANVRKYTGMSADQVKALNEEFKKMDTRTSRQELNQLAQEAGRLGKSSQEDVLGFVRAADKINVALDDLGKDATLILSKLTGIFGDEQRLGTEKALLSVGSVINELSQNCSASAPYIAEFASRMGGVGSQAGMSVQQIMGFAAVLDSNNQKLEASSTALSQVIVRIYQDPAKYARVAGMDVQKFSNLVKTDMNAALIEFLSTLNKAGNMDVLSPMFKDMGENGSRAIAALSTLSKHIDEVKSQQLVANQAFEEATSIDKEFNVQNNTVQAELDKARKRVNELAVELGEKLQPVMRLVISSSTVALKVLSAIVTFFIEHRRVIITATIAIVAYNSVLLIHATRTTLAAKATVIFNGALKFMSGIIPALRLMFTPLVNAVQYFSNGLFVNYTMQLRWRKAVEAMKYSNWAGLIITVAAAVYLLAKRFSDAKDAAEQAQETFSDVQKEANEATASQIKLLDELYMRTQDQNIAQEKRIEAIKKLRKIYPSYFKDISNEAFLAGKAADAYVALKNAILESAKAKGREGQIAKLEGEIQDIQNEYQNESKYWILRKMKIEGKYGLDKEGLKNDPDYALANWNLKVLKNKYQPQIDTKKKIQDSLASQNADYQLQQPSIADEFSDLGGSGNGAAGGSSGPQSESDKFSKEQQWRDKYEAIARISYATGKTDYVKFTKEMDYIAIKYYEKQLAHTDLSESERLKITADYYEAKKVQREHSESQAVDAENKRYNSSLAQIKQFYIDGSISKETYDLKVEEAEIEHQRKLVAATKEGSKERLQAEQQLQSLLIAQMQRKQQEREQLEAKYAAMKKDYFGDNPKEAQAKYDADLALLQVVYDREIQAAGDNAAEKLRIEEAFEKAKLALKKKYGLLSEEDTRNAVEKGIASSLEWLNSDGGKALTGTLDTLVSGMSSIFSQLSSGIQADLQLQTAEINKRYDAEISRAEGNTYKVKKLEKEKEQEIAKVKKEANRKMFAMQVIQAVAQTAQNALNAYGSAAAVPLVGHILAPIAAAMAVAAGAIQIATIKKQQQASEAQGYSEGGFTPPGRKDEAVGVVHAGEWVASQKLVNNPKTRPMLEALDYAQRTNTIGSLTAADVSRSITAPIVLASQPAAQPVVVQSAPTTVVVEQNGEYAATMRRLADRLNEPFVTVNTVAGDHGIQQAQDEYDRLMKNKSPKSRK